MRESGYNFDHQKAADAASASAASGSASIEGVHDACLRLRDILVAIEIVAEAASPKMGAEFGALSELAGVAKERATEMAENLEQLQRKAAQC